MAVIAETLAMIGWLVFGAIAAVLASFAMLQLFRLAILALGCMTREDDGHERIAPDPETCDPCVRHAAPRRHR